MTDPRLKHHKNKELRAILQNHLNRDDFEQQFSNDEYQIAVLLLLVTRLEKLNVSIANLEKILTKIGFTIEQHR
jgi:hypothetical protein